jgi:Protein of unknown function (DUF2950)
MTDGSAEVLGGMHMSRLIRFHGNLVPRSWVFGVLSLAVAVFIACNKPAGHKAEQKTFASPEEAGAAFFETAKSGDQAALLAIFGPDSQNVLLSGDAVKDKDALQVFADSYDKMHRWRAIKPGGETLYIGTDNYAFPIPLGQNPAGQWYFDTAAGKDEILARRIGKGELTAMDACRAIADAQNQYFGQTHDGDKVKQYAQKFISDEGKQNGLYWPVSPGQLASPFKDVRDFAKAVGYTNAGEKPQPFNGYYFRILTKQGEKAKDGAKDYIVNGKMTGGFAALAYPTKYRNSGIMSFLIGADGVLYQKDLGEQTASIASGPAEYNPGDGWTPITD